MRALYQAKVLAILGCLVACGGENTPPPKTPVPVATETVVEPSEPVVDLSPVSAPRDLVLRGHLARPAHTLNTFGRWALGMPVDVRSLLRAAVTGAKVQLDELVAWEAPIQLAGVLLPEQSRPDLDVVVSLGLTDLRRAVSTLREMGVNMERVAPGVYRVSESGRDDETEVASWLSQCAAAASRGPSPARLVCASSLQALDELLPYATRGLPEAPSSGNEFEFEFIPEPLQRHYGAHVSNLTGLSGLLVREGALDHPGFDRALADVAYAVAGELKTLAFDFERLRLTGKLQEASSRFDLSLALKLKGADSWLGATLKDASAVAGPAPEVFWQLPAEVTKASYVHAIERARLRPVLRTLADLFDGLLDHGGVHRAARLRVRELVTDLESVIAVRFVMAEGKRASQAKGALGNFAEVFADELGWQLVVAEVPAAQQLKFINNLHALLNDRDVRKVAAKHLELEAKHLPSSQLKPLIFKGIPAGGKVLVVTLPERFVEEYLLLNNKSFGRFAASDGKLSAVKFAVGIVGDGERTLIAAAAEEKLVGERIFAFKAGKEPALSGRAGLGELRSLKALSAGFMSVGVLRDLAENTNNVWASHVTRFFEEHPDVATMPIVSALKIDASDGVTAELEVQVPDVAFRALAMSLRGLKLF